MHNHSDGLSVSELKFPKTMIQKQPSRQYADFLKNFATAMGR